MRDVALELGGELRVNPCGRFWASRVTVHSQASSDDEDPKAASPTRRHGSRVREPLRARRSISARPSRQSRPDDLPAIAERNMHESSTTQREGGQAKLEAGVGNNFERAVALAPSATAKLEKIFRHPDVALSKASPWGFASRRK